MFVSKKFKLLTLVVTASYVISVVRSDAYIDESRSNCDVKKDLLSCAKYRVLNYIANYTENSIVVNKIGPLRLIRVDDVDDEESFFVEKPRHYFADGEFSKFLKFAQRQVNHFLNHQGIVVSLPQGARLIDDYNDDYKDDCNVENPLERTGTSETRGKKKKADLLLQLITLFKVFKIKVLVAVSLVAILAIKKMLLAAAFVLPSIIHNIKMHCRAAAISTAYHHVDEHDDHHLAYGGISGYGHSGYGNYASDKHQLKRIAAK